LFTLWPHHLLGIFKDLFSRRRKERCKKGSKEEWREGWKEGRMDGSGNGRMERRMDERKNGRMERWKNRRKNAAQPMRSFPVKLDISLTAQFSWIPVSVKIETN